MDRDNSESIYHPEVFYRRYLLIVNHESVNGLIAKLVGKCNVLCICIKSL